MGRLINTLGRACSHLRLYHDAFLRAFAAAWRARDTARYASTPRPPPPARRDGMSGLLFRARMFIGRRDFERHHAPCDYAAAGDGAADAGCQDFRASIHSESARRALRFVEFPQPLRRRLIIIGQHGRRLSPPRRRRQLVTRSP